jgi:hypothetical protein
MAEISTGPAAPVEDELERMHALYRRGGQERQMAPQIVYQDALCPHADCGLQMQAIDFRLEDHGRTIHDPLVRAWWNDTGFAGRCPHCGGWVHFTKRAVTAEEAAPYPQLPNNWHLKATIL